MHPRHHPSVLALALLVLLSGAGCRTRAPTGSTPPIDTERIHALLVNGGGRPQSNYASHLRHLEEMRDVLGAAELPAGRITALSSDGSDPGLDLATRESTPADGFWLLQGTPVESALRPPLTYVTSTLPGLVLRPATRETLTAWAGTASDQIHAGDTLVLFVTDHGTRNKADPQNNAITLWGDGQTISVHELRAVLDRLDPGVRVVAVMSQCFSGSFTNLATVDPVVGPRAVCGYFSTTADRFAYGCYPENRNRDDVGHAFHFLRALRRTGSFSDAHRATLVYDASPDVPLRTSDVFLEQAVRHAAAAQAKDPVAFADTWLARAFADRKRWESEIRLLDAIGERYGIFSPRRLSEVQERLTVVPALGEELKTHRNNWTHSQANAAHANFEQFLAAEPSWPPRLTSQALHDLTPERRRVLTGDVLTDLEAYTRRRNAMQSRLTSLHERSEAATVLAYRMETRVGVLLRMQLVLFRIAGIQYVTSEGTPAERAQLARLLSCEDLRLPVAPPPAGTRTTTREPFPTFEDDVTASQRVVPGWMGVEFRPASERIRRTLAGGVGAASVRAGFPNSPAKEAGLEIGDVIIGPPAERFTEPQQLREWVMTAPLDRPVPLEIMRDGRVRQVVLTPRAYPRVWPQLPGPPKPGSPAPKLGLTPYRGTPPTALAGTRKTLLFFWATWCGICKAALPDLEKAREQLGVEVVAITDEEPEQLDSFFASYRGPFPPVVALDQTRRTFLDYGVSGTPTFVLIDAAGRVAGVKVGYTRAKGLEVLGGP
jgi:thiol-disulfide isomerase/thioredoxin